MQENRRVCKFPCTSRGEGPAGPAAAGGRRGQPAAAPGPAPRRGRGALRALPWQAAAWGQGQAAGRRPVYSPYKAQKTGRRPPLRSGGAPLRGALPGLRPGGLRPSPPPAHIFPNAAAPAFPGPAPGRQLRGAGASSGAGAPFTARTRRRKPAAGPRCAAAGGAPPQGRPARAKPGRPAAAFPPCTGRPKGEKPYPLAPSSSGCSCSPRRAASSAAPVSESSAQRLVGFFRGSSCPKGTK